MVLISPIAISFSTESPGISCRKNGGRVSGTTIVPSFALTHLKYFPRLSFMVTNLACSKVVRVAVPKLYVLDGYTSAPRTNLGEDAGLETSLSSS